MRSIGVALLNLLLALLAGLVTIAAPCTLPVLPILLGASVGQNSRTRPAFIALGFVTSFTVVALLLSTALLLIGSTLRSVALNWRPRVLNGLGRKEKFCE